MGKKAHGESEGAPPGYWGSAGHLLRGNAKGVGQIDQQTFIGRFSKVAFAKLYDRKTRLAAADLLNDRVLPFFEEYEIALSGPRLPQ
jgi:hypothetical protein